MDMRRATSAVRRLESARSAFELTASVLAATVQFVTFAGIALRTLRNVSDKKTRST